MKRTTILASSALALALGAFAFGATPAAATCYYCKSDSASFDYGAGGESSNEGSGYGDKSWAESDSTKDVDGGGSAYSSTEYGSSAQASSSSSFSTSGLSGARSAGRYSEAAGSSEEGSVLGGGMAQTGESWGDHTYTKRVTFDYGAGGSAVNDGTATGDYGKVYSESSKAVSGNGAAAANTGHGGTGASSASSSQFATSGMSQAWSGGAGTNTAGTTEYGQVEGGGFASTSKTGTWSSN